MQTIPSTFGWFRKLTVSEKRDLICLVLGVGTLALFLPVVRFDFINYDDPGYVSENPHVSTGLSLANLGWAFSTLTGGVSYWHPLTWLSYQLDSAVFGLNPGPHHLTNVVFHAANAVLCFLVLLNLTGALKNSALVAAFFAAHPLHVESVAWISERKDVLSTFFLMLTLLAYVRYVRRPKLSAYVLVLLLFVCALMSKPMVVTLPVVLLLLDYWPLGRFASARSNPRWADEFDRFFAVFRGIRCLRQRTGPEGTTDISRGPARLRAPPPDEVTIGTTPWKGAGNSLMKTAAWLVLEKLPFFGLSVAVGLVTFYAQIAVGTLAPLETLSIWERITNSAMAYLLYIWKFLWPANLCLLYQHRTQWGFFSVALASSTLIFASLFAWLRRTRHPHLLVGWLWYLVVLLPAIGLIQVGPQFMADRYTYVSMLGLLIAMVWENRPSFPRPRESDGRRGHAWSACVVRNKREAAIGLLERFRGRLSPSCQNRPAECDRPE